MKQCEDAELIALVSESDAEAFTELYQRHWKYIYGIAYKKTADKNDAFDITQNVFMEFYDKREVLEIHIPLKNYLRTAVIYKLSNYFRTRGFREKHYRNFQQFLEESGEKAEVFSALELQETELRFEEMVELIYKSIDEMPEKMKEIFLMSRSEQYSINEIAGKLNLSPQTVKNQISKALERIRREAKVHAVPAAYLLFLVWLTKS